MFTICEYFEVLKEVEVSQMNGLIIEHCNEFDDALKEFVIYCKRDNIEYVKDWIRENLAANADNCLQNFDSNPEIALNLVCAVKGIEYGISSYTEAFVVEYGGIQEFLDHFCGKKKDKIGLDKSVEMESVSEEEEKDYADYEKYEVSERPITYEQLEIQEKLETLVTLVGELHRKVMVKEIPKEECLDKNDCNELLGYLDLYPATMNKEFFIHLIKNAESQEDFIFLTKIFNYYSTFVSTIIGE